jgi:hypothetical protein
MKLIDLIDDIENVDDESIIFQEDKGSLNSDVILSYAEEGDGGVKNEGGKKYYYLIEIFLAKEFINDWVSSLDYTPSSAEIARRLQENAITDA